MNNDSRMKIEQIKRRFFNLAIMGLLMLAILFQLSACAVAPRNPENSTVNKNESVSNQVEEDTEHIDLPDNADKAPEKNASNQQTKRKHTIMIYMVGADLESENGLASLELDEIAESGVDTSSNTILVNVGGASSWEKEDIDSGAVYILDKKTWKLAEDYQETNMGNPDTLSRFLQYGMNSYKADFSGLILWNHGGGPVIGYGYDEIYDDLLSLNEIGNAMKSAGLGEGNKLDFVGFDACLMGSLEVGDSIRDYADYMIASQETIPGLGWDYSFLEELDQCSSGKEIGKSIIDRYYDYYELLAEYYPELESDITLSCVDLSMAEEVESSLNELFSHVDQQLIKDEYPVIAKSRKDTKAFGVFSTGESYDLVDALDLISHFSQNYKKYTDRLANALEQYVSYNRANIKKANGTSLFHPYDNRDNVEEWMIDYEGLGYAEAYTQYLKDFVYQRYSSKKAENKSLFGALKEGMAQKQEDLYKISVSLTEEQIQNFSHAEYQLVRMEEDVAKDACMLIYSDRAELTEQGNVMANCGKALFVTADGDDDPIPLQNVFDGEVQNQFFAYCNFYKNKYSSDGEFEGLSNIDLVRWQLRIDNGKPKFGEAILVDYYSPVAQKKLLNYKEYNEIEFFAPIRTPAYEEGELLPFDEWQSTGSVATMHYDLETLINGVEYRTIDKTSADYAVYFTIYDVYGNEYRTELIPL